MIKEKSYFYKADDFPEVVVNKSGRIKSLAESCQITLSLEENEDQSPVNIMLKGRKQKNKRIKNAAVLASRNIRKER